MNAIFSKHGVGLFTHFSHECESVSSNPKNPGLAGGLCLKSQHFCCCGLTFGLLISLIKNLKNRRRRKFEGNLIRGLWVQNNKAGSLYISATSGRGRWRKNERKPCLFTQRSPSISMMEEEATENWECKTEKARVGLGQCPKDKEVERRQCYAFLSKHSGKWEALQYCLVEVATWRRGFGKG